MSNRIGPAALLCLLAATAGSVELNPNQQQAKEIFKQLIEINTTHSVGDTTIAAQAMASMFVANLVRYVREGFRPSRDIIIALTADEESGDHNGMDWLAEKHRPLIDSAFAINEGGGGRFQSHHATESADRCDPMPECSSR